MVAIETWLFAMVAIRIATLIATLVETSVPERFRGFESKSQPWEDADDEVSTSVATRVAIRVAIATLNRNPET